MLFVSIRILDRDISIPIANPISIRVVGNIFIDSGIITLLLLIGLIQDNIAPDIIAIDDKISIGVLMLLTSLIIIHGVELFGENIVAIENRME
jgi:hypothetical protein